MPIESIDQPDSSSDFHSTGSDSEEGFLPNEASLVDAWVRFFEEYGYGPKIRELVDTYPEVRSLITSFWEIDRFDSVLANHLLEFPSQALSTGEMAILEFMPSDEKVPLHFRIRDLPKETARIGIRDLRSEHLENFIAIEGLVRKVTDVRPRILEATFECLRCHAHHRIFQDTLIFREPLDCTKETGGCGRAAASTVFKLVPEESLFIDTQKIEIQESPEGLPAGAQPQRLTFYVEDDLTGKVLPGDRIVSSGILKLRQTREGPLKKTLFDIYMDGNCVEHEEYAYEDIEIDDEEKQEIIALSKNENIYNEIRCSIAPSIYGLQVEKEALMLQLFGGVAKTLPDDTRIRGDIHVFLVGDPGTAKSQLLRYISNLSPRGIYASGKASTAAGLTAAAVKDDFGEGRWTLEAGVLVLADQGIACIDEIDKMSNQDRSSMHEAMEQQTIHVAKAGITATLQTRCAILGAANPKFGRFDEFSPIAEQIDLPPTLLSRFDVIFSITDKPNPYTDSEMASHIIRAHYGGEIHEYREKTEDDGRFTREDEREAMISIDPEIDPLFLRKYIAYARKHIFPVMSQEAMDTLKEFYVNLRAQGGGEGAPMPITARQLEAFIRLSEASARIRLSNTATLDDAQRALDIVDYYLSKVAKDDGRFDIDLIASGTSHSQRDRIRSIMNIIRDLAGRQKGGAEVADILAAADDLGIKAEAAQDTIAKLKRDGQIYEPSHGKLSEAR